ncbi:MAG: AAA family ATPase, partial [Gemmatimonadota bacterium]|nr:AAA family ATPase [Gemmatimonadota bacterium]
MIVLHTLGVAAIHLGARRVVPSATRAFASLLFLGIERGRDVPRGELQDLLFPGQGERTAAHNLRQLLYRLRSLGAPVVAGERTVCLPAAEVRDDFSALRAGPLAPGAVEAVSAGILPGYAPTFSPRFAEWVEAQRSRIGHGLLAVLAARLAELRGAGRWRELEPMARAVLGLDPLHEEATLALAECLALSGQKTRAMQLLDDYLGEVGEYGRDLRLPAQVLRTRISERVPGPTHRRMGPGPFVGRDAEMAELWRHYQAAKRGEPRTVVIYGEPGIGKTRLA